MALRVPLPKWLRNVRRDRKPPFRDARSRH